MRKDSNTKSHLQESTLVRRLNPRIQLNFAGIFAIRNPFLIIFVNMSCGTYGLCYYFSHNDTATMNNTTANTASLENLNLVAAISSVLASIYFLAANLLF